MQFLIFMGNFYLGNTRAYFLGGDHCLAGIRFGQDHDEFFTAVARRDILGARGFLGCAVHVFQYLVAQLMAIGVIERFKVINIHHDERKLFVMTVRTLYFLIQKKLEITVHI